MLAKKNLSKSIAVALILTLLTLTARGESVDEFVLARPLIQNFINNFEKLQGSGRLGGLQNYKLDRDQVGLQFGSSCDQGYFGLYRSMDRKEFQESVRAKRGSKNSGFVTDKLERVKDLLNSKESSEKERPARRSSKSEQVKYQKEHKDLLPTVLNPVRFRPQFNGRETPYRCYEGFKLWSVHYRYWNGKNYDNPYRLQFYSRVGIPSTSPLYSKAIVNAEGGTQGQLFFEGNMRGHGFIANFTLGVPLIERTTNRSKLGVFQVAVRREKFDSWDAFSLWHDNTGIHLDTNRHQNYPDLAQHTPRVEDFDKDGNITDFDRQIFTRRYFESPVYLYAFSYIGHTVLVLETDEDRVQNDNLDEVFYDQFEFSFLELKKTKGHVFKSVVNGTKVD